MTSKYNNGTFCPRCERFMQVLRLGILDEGTLTPQPAPSNHQLQLWHWWEPINHWYVSLTFEHSAFWNSSATSCSRFPWEAISHNFPILSRHSCHNSPLIKSLWPRRPVASIGYSPCCIDWPGLERLFEGCWSSIYTCNTFVLIKCSHSMEIGSLTKWLEPAVIRLIAATVAARMPQRSIFSSGVIEY